MRSLNNIIDEIANEVAEVDLKKSPFTKIERLRESSYKQDLDMGDLGKTRLEFNVVLDRKIMDKPTYIFSVEFPSFYALWIENPDIDEEEAISKYGELCNKLSRKDYRVNINRDGMLNFELLV
ncbi:MAG: hypothetical protein Q7S27_07155 [Nanoarchaeota archaeon]|nr:hypothetical protein [Nanoarchaeota archaeon]